MYRYTVLRTPISFIRSDIKGEEILFENKSIDTVYCTDDCPSCAEMCIIVDKDKDVWEIGYSSDSVLTKLNQNKVKNMFTMESSQYIEKVIIELE